MSREQMEDDINAGKLLEYGEYKGNLYGTSGESVQSIVSAGYVCILNPHYQVGIFLYISSLWRLKFSIICKLCTYLNYPTQ